MNNLSSGGLAIVVVAALWFLVLMPSFIKNDQGKAKILQTKPKIRESVELKLGPQATEALRAKRVRNLTVVVSPASYLVGALSLLDFATNGASLVIAIFATIIAIASTVAMIRINRNFKILSAQSAKRDLPISLSNTKSISEPVFKNPNAFKPDSLPSQNFLRTGAIEVVTLADVVSIEDAKPATEIDNLDEILRRRRHLG